MIKTLLVDDEQPARERLRAFLDSHPEVEIVDEAENGVSAIEKIEALQPDLVFLDIQMPGCSGLEVIRSLSTERLPKVIFCTAYDQFAVQAFELNAVDYLLKPVTRARLAESLRRVKQAALPDTRKLESLIAAFRNAGPKATRRFLGRRAKRIYLINEHEILYFKVDNNLVFIVTESGEYWTNYTLAEIETAVDSALFVRTHRQYIVSLDKIKEIAPLAGGNYLLRMANGSQVEVSRRQSRRLLERLGKQ
jgi:DNA-binding LytR/AlgR family response regulator